MGEISAAAARGRQLLFLSQQFPNVYLRLDGAGITAPLPSGGGTVNGQYTADGGLTAFIIKPV